MREWIHRLWRACTAPRMLYGWRGSDGMWRAHTRLSSKTHIEDRSQLMLADHVYVGHFNVLDASGGLTIDEGVQITTHCAVLSHSSHDAVRRAGRSYWGHPNPPGFAKAATRIGAYSFIGPHCVIAPGAQIGRGVLVRAFSYVSGVVPDFAIVGGQPAVVLGDTRERDTAWLAANAELRHPYDAWAQL